MRSYDFDNSKSNENGSADDYAEYQEFLRYKEAKRQYEQSVQQQTAPKTVSAPVNDSARERASAEAFVKEKAKMLLGVIVLIAVGVFAVRSYQKYQYPVASDVERAQSVVTEAPQVVSAESHAMLNTSYETIYEDYAQRLRTATSDLYVEFVQEIMANADDNEFVMGVFSEKLDTLRQIHDEGMVKLVLFLYEQAEASGEYVDGKDIKECSGWDEAESWGEKLDTAYADECERFGNACQALFAENE